MNKYEVAIVFKEQVNYIVEAENKEEAEEIAKARWENGEPPDDLGNEWAEIERVSTELAGDDDGYDEVWLAAVERFGNQAASVWMGTAGGPFADSPRAMLEAGKADLLLEYLKAPPDPA